MSTILASLAGALLMQGAGGVDYTITIDETADGASVTMRLEFAGEADGETVLHLPNEWGGQGELWNGVQNLEVSGGEAHAGDTPDLVILEHAPDAQLSVTYSIVQDRPGDPGAESGDYYRPFVQPDYVHLIGNTVFAFPEREADTAVSVSISAPDGWALASDLEHGPVLRDDLMTSVLVAGDFRITEMEIDGAPLRLAMRGDIGVEDEALMASLQAVITANHAYWATETEPYLVTVLPLTAPEGWMSVGGTNLGDSFAFFSTSNATPDVLTRILMHEYVHSWNPRLLGGGLEGEREPTGYWFSEGFTDFVTQRAAVRAGVWPAEQAIEAWNGTFVEYRDNPVRDAANDAIIEGFWIDGNFQRLPYLRGMMFAALVDNRIRNATSGAFDVDDVLLAMRSRTPDNPASEAFAGTVQRVTGLDISDLIARHIEAGEPIVLDANTFGACGPVAAVEEPVFVYGMEGARNEEGRFVIQTVDPNGPAAPAGFEPGMIILQRTGGAVGDASVESVLRVSTPDGDIRELSYWPTDGSTQTVTRIEPDAAGFDATACTARMAGTDAGAPAYPMP
ncbi:M61 family metallopeptidase [Maricaulis parjimensis]|uniref:M61 family metallopeptidase n=1 Tax=Maricaulis parjimensis TaxID=144023 RepID=UPI00193A5A5E|nr:M61 family metallopeptidase [Maricaulis parjimensis]